jgi:hypothetical protein
MEVSDHSAILPRAAWNRRRVGGLSFVETSRLAVEMRWVAAVELGEDLAVAAVVAAGA